MSLLANSDIDLRSMRRLVQGSNLQVAIHRSGVVFEQAYFYSSVGDVDQVTLQVRT